MPIFAVILAIAGDDPARVKRTLLLIPGAAVPMVGVNLAIGSALRQGAPLPQQPAPENLNAATSSHRPLSASAREAWASALAWAQALESVWAPAWVWACELAWGAVWALALAQGQGKARNRRR